METTQKPLRVLLWGTGDSGKPRVRILQAALKHMGAEVTDVRYSIWAGVEDKSQLGQVQRVRYLLRWALAYPRLIWRYVRAPRHDLVLVTYPGQLDVLVLWPFAKLRRARIVWDVFLSWYDAVAVDRQMSSNLSPTVWLPYIIEWLACRAADALFLDTAEHARYIERTYKLAPNSVERVFVGVEPDAFVSTSKSPVEPGHVLFYGQFIPLHGIETILQAIALLERRETRPHPGMHFTIVGKGQTQELMDDYIKRLGLKTVTRRAWVPYAELKQLIASAHVALGIFSTSGKASRVIPNKVFQILAVGTPLITRDSPAIQELGVRGGNLTLVPAGNPAALADAIAEGLGRERAVRPWVFGPADVAVQLREVLERNS